MDAYQVAIYDEFEGYDVRFESLDLADCYAYVVHKCDRECWVISGPEGQIDASDKTEEDVHYQNALTKYD